MNTTRTTGAVLGSQLCSMRLCIGDVYCNGQCLNLLARFSVKAMHVLAGPRGTICVVVVVDQWLWLWTGGPTTTSAHVISTSSISSNNRVYKLSQSWHLASILSHELLHLSPTSIPEPLPPDMSERKTVGILGESTPSKRR
jgi:hypothetical protein